jgi:RimJ/RimL family protein N-acetyltransferase
MSHNDSTETPLVEVAKRLQPSHDSFVFGAFSDGLVGIVGFFRRPEMKIRHKGTIWGMYVTPEARGMGLGKGLMNALIQHASSIPHLEQLILSVVTTNEAAHHLYLSLGFKSYGIERSGLKLGDNYLDEELMMLKLTEKNSR